MHNWIKRSLVACIRHPCVSVYSLLLCTFPAISEGPQLQVGSSSISCVCSGFFLNSIVRSYLASPFHDICKYWTVIYKKVKQREVEMAKSHGLTRNSITQYGRLVLLSCHHLCCGQSNALGSRHGEAPLPYLCWVYCLFLIDQYFNMVLFYCILYEIMY